MTIADMNYPHTLAVQNAQVPLNDADIRYKAVLKVYTAGLSLSKPENTAQEAFAQPRAKGINVAMLRAIDSSSLGRL